MSGPQHLNRMVLMIIMASHLIVVVCRFDEYSYTAIETKNGLSKSLGIVLLHVQCD